MRFKRIVTLLLTVIITCSSVIPAYAAKDTSAAAMTSSMISCFNTGADLDVSKVSGNELAVYGVFLSNFLMPGSSKIGDLGGDELAKTIATNFDVSEDIAKQLNETVKKVISETINKDEAKVLKGKKEMDGWEWVNAFSEKDVELKTHGGSQTLLKLGDEPTRAAFEIIFGINPAFFFDANSKDDNSPAKGLYTMSSTRVDAFGNIWVSQSTESEDDDYVLFMPACLNPCLFDNKLPIANSFAMGAMVDLKKYDIANILNNSSDAVKEIKKLDKPAYLLGFQAVWRFSPKRGDKRNLVNIYGINSPAGNLNTSLKGDAKTAENFAKMLDTDANIFDSSSTKNYLVVAMNPAEFTPHVTSGKNTVDLGGGGGDDTLAYKYDNWHHDDTAIKKKALQYLVGSSVIDMESQVDANFIWFNFNSDTLKDAVNKASMRDIKLEDFTTTQNLFYTDDGSTKKFTNAVMSVGLTQAVGNKKGKEPKLTDEASASYDDLIANKKGIFTVGRQLVSYEPGTEGTGYIKNPTYANTFNAQILLYSSDMATDSKWVIGKGLTAEGEVTIIPGAGTSHTETFKEWLNLGAMDSISIDASSVIAISMYKAFAANEAVISVSKGSSTEIGAELERDGAKKKYKTFTNVANKANVWANIYWTYIVKLLHVSSLNNVGGFNYPALPTSSTLTSNLTSDLSNQLTSDAGKSSEANTYEEKQKKLLDTIMNLLDPKPNEERNSILRGILNGFLIDTHKAITGSRLASSITAGVSHDTSKSYSSVVGYISSPPLKDLPFTSWVAEHYMYIYLFLLLIVTIVLIMMVLSNLRTWRQGAVMFLVMAFALVLPQSLLNNAVILGNKFADSMFNDRFTYWAVVEREMQVQKAELASAKGTVAETVQQNVNHSAVYDKEATGVKVKWMAPKKNDVFKAIFNDVISDTALGNNLTLFKWMFSSFFTGDEYVNDDPLATYVYRTYTDIASDAKSYYEKCRGMSLDVPTIRSNIMSKADASDRVIKQNLKFIGADYFADPTERGGVNNTISDVWGNTEFGDNSPYNVHTGYGILQSYLINNVKCYTSTIVSGSSTGFQLGSGQAMNDALGNDSTARYVMNATNTVFAHRYWHLNNEEVLNCVLSKDPADTTDPGMRLASGDLDASMQMYLAYTESPYYYFYNVLADTFNATGDFKTALTNDNFYKYYADGMKSDGEIRDFLDMEGLFTTVIPVLYQSNLYVREYDKINGLNIETYNFEEYKKKADEKGDSASITTDFTDAQNSKERAQNVWMMYSPWVDFMYELPVGNKTVTYMDKKVKVGDGLNPGAYDEVGRPIVYSQADMKAKHMKYSNLSDVEIRIQRVLDATYTDMLYLLNYYDFDNETLLSTAAMFATFNFNKEFSGSALLGNNGTIYPQSFELKNFNYDAFLRLTLMNATGIPLSDVDTDLYEQILNKTSWWTGLMIIFVDIMAVYAIPACKVIIMLLLLFLGLLFCVTCVVSPPEKVMQSLGKSILLPTVLYLLCNMAFSLVVALFMGEGLTSYVGSRTANISINDPTVTVLLLILVSAIYLWLLIKLIKLLFTTFKSYGISSVMGIVAIAAGAGAVVGRSVKNFARGNLSRARFRKDLKSSMGGGGMSNLPDNGDGEGTKHGSGGLNRTTTSHGNSKSDRGGNKFDREKVKQGMSDFKKQIEDKAASFGTKVSDYSKQMKKKIDDNGGVRTSIGKAGVKVKHSVKNKVQDLASSARDYDYKGAAKSAGRKIGNSAVSVKSKTVAGAKSAFKAADDTVNKGWNKTTKFARSTSNAIKKDMTEGRAERKAKVANYNKKLAEKRKTELNRRAKAVNNNPKASDAMKKRAVSHSERANKEYSKAVSRSRKTHDKVNKYKNV